MSHAYRYRISGYKFCALFFDLAIVPAQNLPGVPHMSKTANLSGSRILCVILSQWIFGSFACNPLAHVNMAYLTFCHESIWHTWHFGSLILGLILGPNLSLILRHDCNNGHNTFMHPVSFWVSDRVSFWYLYHFGSHFEIRLKLSLILIPTSHFETQIENVTKVSQMSQICHEILQMSQKCHKCV